MNSVICLYDSGRTSSCILSKNGCRGTQQTKHEYLNGRVVAMAGATVNHNQILTNIIVSIGSYLKKKNCNIYPSDLRLAVKSKNSYFYPDATIVCNKLEFADGKNNIIQNPSVIFEILSPSTSNIDVGRKFFFYMQVESLKEYVIIDSKLREVSIARNNEEGLWKAESFFEETDSIYISAINYNLAMEDIMKK